jgi:hypothetical protein
MPTDEEAIQAFFAGDSILLARYLRETSKPSSSVIGSLKRAFDPREDVPRRLRFARRGRGNPGRNARADAVRDRIADELAFWEGELTPATIQDIAEALDPGGASRWALKFEPRRRTEFRTDLERGFVVRDVELLRRDPKTGAFRRGSYEGAVKEVAKGRGMSIGAVHDAMSAHPDRRDLFPKKAYGFLDYTAIQIGPP